MSDDNHPYILRRETIDHLNAEEKHHFLNGEARRTNKSLGDLIGLSGFGFHLVEVQPGRESTVLHKHYQEDEAVYILEGTAEATIGDKVFILNAGDFVGYPADGEPHKLRNCGDSVLRCIVVGQRLDHDVVDYPGLRKRLYRQKDMPWNVVNFDDISEP